MMPLGTCDLLHRSKTGDVKLKSQRRLGALSKKDAFLLQGARLSLFWIQVLECQTSSQWSRRESNPRPLACHASALPAELRPHAC